jgi:hypothetical protein
MLVLRLKTCASSSALLNLLLVCTLCRQKFCLASRHPSLAAADPQQSHSSHHQGAAVIKSTAQGVSSFSPSHVQVRCLRIALHLLQPRGAHVSKLQTALLAKRLASAQVRYSHKDER